MRGKEELIPHAARAGRWLGWLTVWSDLSTPVPRCLLCPGCEFGVCEFRLCLLPAAGVDGIRATKSHPQADEAGEANV